MTDIFESQPLQLEELEEHDREDLIKLPYRVGMYISQSDISGGDVSDEKELNALEIIITTYAQDYCKSEFVQQVMNETVSRKDDWPGWSVQIENAPQECGQMLRLLDSKLILKDMEAFKTNLYEIGLAVALAYRETNRDMNILQVFLKKTEHYCHYKNFRKIGQDPLQWEEFLNISRDENKALKNLANALEL